MKIKSKTENTSHSNSPSSKPFFNKSGEGSFFSNSKEVEPPFFTPSNIQTKLTIGEPGSKYEQEADTIVDKVVSSDSIICNGQPHNKPKVQGGKNNEEREKTKDSIQRAPDEKVPDGPEWKAGQHVTPNYVADRPTPIRSNTKSSTTDAGTASLPTTFTGHAAENKSDKTWRYQIDTIESKGKIQIVYFTTDRYPAPNPTDDSGALSNVSKENWKDIVKDLNDNREGIPDFWSAYRAEDLHEEYHWEKEWQVVANKEVGKAEAEIDKLSVLFGEAATATEAEAKLKPKATKIFDKAIKQARTNWMAMGDSAGDPPYKAQAPALDALKDRVNEHVKKEKW